MKLLRRNRDADPKVIAALEDLKTSYPSCRRFVNGMLLWAFVNPNRSSLTMQDVARTEDDCRRLSEMWSKPLVEDTA